jgi:hypothetical protein
MEVKICIKSATESANTELANTLSKQRCKMGILNENPHSAVKLTINTVKQSSHCSIKFFKIYSYLVMSNWKLKPKKIQ